MSKFNPTRRDGGHYLKVTSENPGTLLISGGVLSEAIEKSFKEFVEFISEEEAHKPPKSLTKKKRLEQFNKFKSSMKNLNEMMLS